MTSERVNMSERASERAAHCVVIRTNDKITERHEVISSKLTQQFSSESAEVYFFCHRCTAVGFR